MAEAAAAVRFASEEAAEIRPESAAASSPVEFSVPCLPYRVAVRTMGIRGALPNRKNVLPGSGPYVAVPSFPRVKQESLLY